MKTPQFTNLEFKLFQFFCKIDASCKKNSLQNSQNHVNAEKIVLNLLVSGGQDSMCLLNAVSAILNSKRFQPQNQFTLVVTHFNHKKRGVESDEDAFLVLETCLNLGVECFYFEILNNSENTNFQDFARRQRRQIAKDLCQKICSEQNCTQYFVLTAHHARDHVESVFLHMIRGSGIVGLQGFYAAQDPCFLKPFAEMAYADIQQYAHQKKIHYRTDSSNDTDDYDRNFLRHHILPQFEKLNLSYEKNILRCSKQLREISERFIQGSGLEYSSNVPHEGVLQSPFVFSSTTTASEVYFYLKTHLNDETMNISANSVNNILSEVSALQSNPHCRTKTIPLKNNKKLTIYKSKDIENKIYGVIEIK